ncbi:hypothetical protein WR25_16184 [Diploscapter pachys]|uniref:Partner of Y14 and mago n=1 Tax=Diploscapter pachys TaxID=2018661 RepID=A0A2A2KTZ6_9BILA|nr:hypothetical protein WR25_16184 [Diploscapter pachys]
MSEQQPNMVGDLRVKTKTGETYIAATRRPDGTWRKARKVKEGYIPQDEQPKYQNRMQAAAAGSQMPTGITPRQMQAMLQKQQQDKKPVAAIVKPNACITQKDHVEKKLVNAKKKLQEIEQMEKKFETGEEKPLPNQVTKMARKPEYQEEIDKLTAELEKL